MGQPHNPRPGVGTAQVDVRQVRAVEAEKYQQIIQGLVLDNAVLQVALNDAQQQAEEDAAKIQALSGMSTGPKPATVPPPRPAPPASS